MDFASVLEAQVRVQIEAIKAAKLWALGIVAAGLLFAGLGFAHIIPVKAPSAEEIVKIGGLVISLFSMFPYREMVVPHKERLATYRFLLERCKGFEKLSPGDQAALLAMVTEALKETWKR